MTSDERIRQAARVMARAYFGEPVEQDDMECSTEWARALDSAGLLAPSPLREEWGVRWDDHDVWGDMYRNRAEAEAAANGEGEPVHRWVSDWEKA